MWWSHICHVSIALRSYYRRDTWREWVRESGSSSTPNHFTTTLYAPARISERANISSSCAAAYSSYSKRVLLRTLPHIHTHKHYITYKISIVKFDHNIPSIYRWKYGENRLSIPNTYLYTCFAYMLRCCVLRMWI